MVEILCDAVSQSRARGMEWWTAAEINAWERARRAAEWTAHDGARACLKTGAALQDATILWLGSNPGTAQVNGVAHETESVERWGFSFQSVEVQLEQGGEYALEWQPCE